VGVVHDSVKHGIGDGWVADEVVPGFDGQLTGDDPGSSAVSVLNNLEDVPPLLVAERSEPQSSRMSTSAFAKRSKQPHVRPVSVC
jgi:hypothetical protein